MCYKKGLILNQIKPPLPISTFLKGIDFNKIMIIKKVKSVLLLLKY